MTLTQLRYLAAILDCDLNVTAAAVRLNATQSGVSKQVKLLEQELGFQIFVRMGKCLDRVTPAGERVVAHARAVLAEVQQIRGFAIEQRASEDMLCNARGRGGEAQRCTKRRTTAGPTAVQFAS